MEWVLLASVVLLFLYGVLGFTRCHRIKRCADKGKLKANWGKNKALFPDLDEIGGNHANCSE